MNRKVTFFRGLCYLLLLILAATCIVPFYNIFINATHENAEIASGYLLIPGNHLKENYETLIHYIDIWKAFGNSVFFAVTYTVLSAYFSAMTAYGFAKFKFRFKGILFGLLLGTMMLPSQLGLIGYFQLMDSFHLLDNYLSLIIPSVANASAVFFIRQFLMSGVPDSLLESARIDGCSEIGIFHKIVLPLIKPAVFAQAIFVFVSSWNNFINPLILIFSPNKLPLPVVIQQLNGTYATNYGVVYLGVAISVIPIVVFASIFMKQIVGGITVGAVKG